MTRRLKYRPHHFLCSLGFEGKGYSDSFTANMEAIVMGRLRADAGKETEIEVVGLADDICGPCPKRRGTSCTDQEKIDSLDAAHSRALRIDTGDRLTWAEALLRIRERVRPETLDRICAGCAWLEQGMCKAALERLRAKSEREDQ